MEPQRSSLATILPAPTSEPLVSSSELIRQFLVKAGEVYGKQITPALVSIWIDALGEQRPETLKPLLRRVLRECKFFPTPAEVLGPISTAEQAATPEAADLAWKQVLDIRRLHWNPDIPGPLARELAKLPERIRQAARAAGIFREFTATEWENGALNTWAKKRFVESFTNFGQLEQGEFLLPDGEVKTLLAEVATKKALPAPLNWSALHARGKAYSQELKQDECEQPDIKRALRALTQRVAPPPSLTPLDEQKKILRAKGYKLE